MSEPINAEEPAAEPIAEAPAVPVEGQEAAPEPEAPAEPPPPQPPYKAILDRFGIIQRYERTDGEGIVVPEDCDLPPGKYRWDKEKGQFVPIMQAFGKPNAVDHPSAIAAIAEGFKAIRDGKPLPIITLDWIVAYERSMDAMK